MRGRTIRYNTAKDGQRVKYLASYLNELIQQIKSKPELLDKLKNSNSLPSNIVVINELNNQIKELYNTDYISTDEQNLDHHGGHSEYTQTTCEFVLSNNVRISMQDKILTYINVTDFLEHNNISKQDVKFINITFQCQRINYHAFNNFPYLEAFISEANEDMMYEDRFIANCPSVTHIVLTNKKVYKDIIMSYLNDISSSGYNGHLRFV